MIIILTAIILGLLIAIVAIIVGFKSRQTDAKLPGDTLSQALKDNRMELSNSLKNATDSINRQFTQLQTVITTNLKEIREDNSRQLDQMRKTVDEKLQSTLEKRLSESFKMVSQQLETVHKSMGEMQSLATDVGELQNTLSGVKTRGVWGEAHLANLLTEVLNPQQYTREFQPNPQSKDKVEFALKIPADGDQILYLPVDAKFPLTKFENLQKAIAQSDKAQVGKASKALEAAIKTQAKEINKYIYPPVTTDFAIMYLPLESLYAEIAQNTILVTEMRQKYKITLAGPSTILPMLAVLNLGYRSLTIQKHVAQVWDILRETQDEFIKFGDLMDKAQKKLNEASNVIDSASTKTRTIESKFKKVQKLDYQSDSLKNLKNIN